MAGNASFGRGPLGLNTITCSTLRLRKTIKGYTDSMPKAQGAYHWLDALALPKWDTKHPPIWAELKKMGAA